MMRRTRQHILQIAPEASLGIALVILLIGTTAVSGQTASNLERFQLAALHLGDSVLTTGTLPDRLCLNVVDHAAAWLVEQGIIDAAAARGTVIEDCQPPYTNEILLAVTESSVRYVQIDDDNMSRELKLGISLSIPKLEPGGRSIERVTERRSTVFADTIPLSDASFIESDDYAFTQGRLTVLPRKKSIWKSIAEPAIVIGTSITMIILLFTARGS